MAADELIRTGEAAAILGSSRQHVVDLCDRGTLTTVRSPVHRRVSRGEVEALAGRRGRGEATTRARRRSLWLHRAVAGKVAAHPNRSLRLARANLRRLREVHPSGMSARWLREWEGILHDGPEAVMDTLTADTPHAAELRQNSPFAGLLSERERQTVLDAFRDLER